MDPQATRHDRLFLGLFAGIAVARIALLAVSQHSVCGDEAAVGVMAKHIIEQGEHPVFAWHEHYNGGAALTAYLATIPFGLFGMTERALKLVPLAFSLAALPLVYRLVRSARDDRGALLATLLYGTCVALLKWSFDARGGYAECQVLIPLALWVLHSRCLGPQATPANDALQGLLCGFAVYLLPLSLPLGLTSLAFLLVRGRLTGAWGGAAAWTAGALAGASPLLLFGASSGPVSLDPRTYLPRIVAMPVTLVRTLAFYLPGALSYDNLDDYPPMRLVPNVLEYFFLLFAIGTLIALSRGTLAALGRALRERRAAQVPLEAVLLGYAVVYSLLYSLHPDAGQEARHLLFLEPPLSILAGLGIADALARPGRLARVASLALALTLCDRGAQYVRVLGDDGVYGPLGRSDPRDAVALIEFLRERGLAHVMSEDWDLSWRIVFKTQERVTATHSVLWLGRLFRQGQLRSGAYALIIPRGDRSEQRLRHLLAKEGISEGYVVAGRTVYVLPAGDRRGPRQPAP